MKFNLNIYHRKSICLKNWDYSIDGLYLVTICTFGKECLLGEIVDGEMRLNEYGRIVEKEILKTGKIRNDVFINSYIVMPNHVHMVVGFAKTLRRSVLPYAPTFRSPSNNLGSIIRGFKSTTTKQINILRNDYSHSLWQRNYHEHIVRNKSSLIKIQTYIINNPLNWHLDKLNSFNPL